MASFTAPFAARLVQGTSALRSDRRGNVLMMFALACPVLMLGVGAAVDFSSAAWVQTRVAGATDAASLSAAKLVAAGVTDRDRITAEARGVFDANFGTGIDWITVKDFAAVPDFEGNEVKVSVSATLPTAFMAIAGHETLTVGGASTAHTGKSIEVAMMLDVTGSMDYAPGGGRGEKKIDTLERAAQEFVKTMLADAASTRRTRIALAPFAAGVNAGSLGRAVTGVTGAKCTLERRSTSGALDAAPSTNYLRTGSSCPSNAVVPLTNDRAALLAALTDLKPMHSTAGHLGTQWSQYLLSPDWATALPVRSAPKAYGTQDVEKIAILMTDGAYNTYGGVWADEQRDWTVRATINRKTREAALASCDDMKAKGVVVFTIGFDLGDASATSLLKSCATSFGGEEAFYDARDDASLKAAYRDIAARILQLRISA